MTSQADCTSPPCWRGEGGKDGHTERSEIQPDHEQGKLGHLYLYMRRWWLLVQDSHEEQQFPKGTTMAAAEPRLVLDNVADVFQLLVAQLAFVKPFLSADVHSNRRWCSEDVCDEWQESLENEFQGCAASLHVTFIFTLE